MFTSRAEFRLHLRIDNADERLTPLGRKLGLVSDERWTIYERKQQQKREFRALLEANRMDPSNYPRLSLPLNDRPTIAEWLRRPEARIRQIASQLFSQPVSGVLDTLETECKYAGYIAQQQRQVDRLREAEGRAIPADFSYTDIPGLSTEAREKLAHLRPETLGQASRIPGITPAAIAVLDVYLRLDR
jgi:tRNA uridine 5-carboxymethylaminomethyl modification enzyme